MSKGRLTRHELSWLLTQEAQNAAERLRVGVQVLRAGDAGPSADPAQHVDASLDALDDVMRMLSSLNQRAPAAGAGRRGRIDLATLLMEVAPAARVSIEPGSGTEVAGDEADLRRMLQVLVGGAGAQVMLRREGDSVRVAVVLGPDASPSAETERAWLSRMAMRYGGRHELEGASEILVLPADGAADKEERAALLRELDEARKQGEAYARDLAAVFDRGEEVASASSYPPPGGPVSLERFQTLTKVCAGISLELRTVLGPAARELGAMRRHEVTDEQLETLKRRVAHAQEIIGNIGWIGELRPDELATEVELGAVVSAAVKECGSLAERAEVSLVARLPSSGQRAYARGGPKATAALARALVSHAVGASPRGASVEVAVVVDEARGARLVVDDTGSPLPASARRAFLALETHAGAYGRPSGLPIALAAELAACQGATLELSDAPQGGLRVAVTFANS